MSDLVGFTWSTKGYLDNLFKQEIPLEAKTDQIAAEFDNLDYQIEKLEKYKKIATNKINELKKNKVKTSNECAKWFLECGVDKIEGIGVSSITINKATKPTSKKKKKFISLFSSIEDMQEYLVSQNMGRFEEYEETVESKPPTVRINKRRT
jgi:uncharacterized protein YdcH (DUF465 family)